MGRAVGEHPPRGLFVDPCATGFADYSRDSSM